MTINIEAPGADEAELRAALTALHGHREFNVTATPAPGDWNSPLLYFSGDLSKVGLSAMNFISGTTLGQPTSGYKFTEEAYPFLGGLYNTSGHNNSTSINDGRTSANFSRIHIYQAGQGDCVAFNATGYVTSTKVGATNFLANPAIVVLNGSVNAGVAGCYLNAVEINCTDNGFDAAGIGFVTNLSRTNNAGALGVWWAAYRAQSKGNLAVDVMFSASGPAKIGLDLSFVTLDANNAAITLKADQSIYWNVTATDPTSQSRFPSSVSTTRTWFSSANVGFQMTVNNTNIYLLTVAQSLLYPLTTVLGQGQNNRISITAGASGVTPAIATTGTADTDVDLALSPKGAGVLRFGTHTTKAAEVHTGYITIKDAGGTLRKVMVCS